MRTVLSGGTSKSPSLVVIISERDVLLRMVMVVFSSSHSQQMKIIERAAQASAVKIGFNVRLLTGRGQQKSF